MNTVYVDPAFSADRVLQEIYNGQIVMRSPSPVSRVFVQHARDAIASAFEGLDPLTAQRSIDVEDFVDRFAPLKTTFIHDPRSRLCIRAILEEWGFDPEDTYIDVPRLRVATSDGYLTSGVAYAHHAHRDTWYSAPLSQLNWWMPIFDYASSAGMAFHPRYWSKPVRNGSSTFDYYRWNAEGRAVAKQHIRTDTRVQPRAEEMVELAPELRVVVRSGGLVVFSGAQLHSTCKNDSGMSRWSVDFRTVSLSDLIGRRGAPNLDSRPTGTSLRDFVRMRDFDAMPESVVRQYDDRTDVEGTLVFTGAGDPS